MKRPLNQFTFGWSTNNYNGASEGPLHVTFWHFCIWSCGWRALARSCSPLNSTSVVCGKNEVKAKKAEGCEMWRISSPNVSSEHLHLPQRPLAIRGYTSPPFLINSLWYKLSWWEPQMDRGATSPSNRAINPKDYRLIGKLFLLIVFPKTHQEGGDVEHTVRSYADLVT